MPNNRDFRSFSKGYQSAMIDIRDALDRGGEDAVRQWVSDNLIVSRKDISSRKDEDQISSDDLIRISHLIEMGDGVIKGKDRGEGSFQQSVL